MASTIFQPLPTASATPTSCADPLKPNRTATTVRGGGAIVTDGPFAETKEQLAGYYILDCADLDAALAWARRIPTAS